MYALTSCEGASAWIVDPRSSQPRNVTSPTSYALTPHLSPDGQTVAFSGVGSRGAYLALAKTDLSKTFTPITGASGIEAGDFSPDGRWLTFAVVPEQPSFCFAP